VIGAVYMLRAVRAILHGPLPIQETEIPPLADAVGWWRKLPFAILFVALAIFGIWPRSLTEKIQPSAQRILAMATSHKAPQQAAAQTLAQASQSLPVPAAQTPKP
jgi:NADH:ubiquinone oxidoreductase subunit 4 (subunit M)